MLPPTVTGRPIVLVIGLWFFVPSHDVSAESAQRSCLPNCASILDLAGPQAAEDLRGLADLIRERVKEAGSGREKLEILNQFFFNGLRFEAENTVDSAEGILPGAVLAHRRGSCLGLTGVYLALSDLLEMPVAAVSAPSHVFVRFDDSHVTINVELLQAGKALEDDWYVHIHKIPASSIESGVFLRALSEREFLGQIYATLGSFYSRTGDFANSRILYEAAVHDAPQLPSAYYNLGNDLFAQGRFREALLRFTQSLELYPTDPFALNNRGLSLCRIGKTRRARKDFQAAIDLDPSFTQARSNLTELRCGRE